ncbi:MAG: hypothetical protein EBZ77_06615, partial [Chitinophagia bacterium]|nr:hypothetical protein [Chitinophagia bacterium]
TYSGDHGYSLRLDGMDPGFNDAARNRNIVIHGADYVSDQFIVGNQRLGRSWGCPAVPEHLKKEIISAIQGGTCLFIYKEDDNYSRKSFWLNRKIEHLPVQSEFSSLVLQPREKQRKVIIEYRHGSVVDSTREVTLPAVQAKP